MFYLVLLALVAAACAAIAIVSATASNPRCACYHKADDHSLASRACTLCECPRFCKWANRWDDSNV